MRIKKRLIVLGTMALCTMSVSAQITEKVWDFTAFTEDDIEALRSNTAAFTDDEGNQRIKNAVTWSRGTWHALEGSDGTDISVAEGLLFGRPGGDLNSGSFYLSYKATDKKIYFNNSNSGIKLPTIKGGQEVVITSGSWNGTLTLTNGQDANVKAGEATFTVTADGEVEIKFGSKMSDLKSIEVRDKVADATPPTLKTQIPAVDAKNVIYNGNIVLTFDESIKAIGETVTATLNGADIIGTVSGAKLTFAYTGLSLDTDYTFNLPANQVSDIAGNAYASAVNFTFTTVGSSVVWPFKVADLAQAPDINIINPSNIASYAITKGSNLGTFEADVARGTKAAITEERTVKSEDTFVQFAITPVAGKAFIPTGVEFEGSRIGSGGIKYHVYWLNSDGTEACIQNNVDPGQDNPLLRSFDLKNVDGLTVGEGECGLKLYFTGAAGKSIGLWNIKLIGAVGKRSITISYTGWSTYSCSDALDFTGMEVKAYMINGHNGNSVTTTAVNGDIPANTGLLLNGTPNKTYYVPVVASSSTSTTGNLLFKGDGSDISAEAGKTKYVLSSNGGDAVFKKIVDGKPTTIPAGNCYLQFNEEIDAPSLMIDGFGNMTAVEGIRTVENGTTTIFNLQGQRMVRPSNGLYIINGKKVVIK